jgi:hypothetical protein
MCPLGVAVQLFSAVLEGLSWRTAIRQLRAEASARHLVTRQFASERHLRLQPRWRRPIYLYPNP